MTKDEIKKTIAYLRTAYKGFCEDMDLTAVINIWHDQFKEEDVHVVWEATRNYTRSSEYPPTIAGIYEQINLIKQEQTDADMWELISKAARNSTYGSAEEFEKLPDVCKKFVGSPAGLKDLGQLDAGTLQTVVKSQFIKTAPKIREHRNVQTGLPAEVRQAISMAKTKLLEQEV